MARRKDDEEDYEKPKKKRNGFWNRRRAAVLAVFLLGIAIGIYIAHFYIEPMLSSGGSAYLQECNNYRASLSEQLDSCLDCMDRFSIEGTTCTGRGLA